MAEYWATPTNSWLEPAGLLVSAAHSNSGETEPDVYAETQSPS
jgi:hypothetical protein